MERTQTPQASNDTLTGYSPITDAERQQDRSIGSRRWFYVKTGLFLYLLWIIGFEAVGRYAATLPPHDFSCALDRAIPLVPQFIWPYVFCYAFPFLLAVIVRDWRRVNQGLLSMLFANLTAFILFIALPIGFPKPVPAGNISERALALEYAVDFHPSAANLPSLHVAFAWLVYFTARKQGLKKPAEYSVLLITLAITVSTLFVKQHIVADVITGFFWAVGAWMLARFFYTRWAGAAVQPEEALRKIGRKSIPFILCAFIVIVLLVCLG